MKIESQRGQGHVFFLAAENVVLHVNEPYKLQKDMIESKNFVPEAFIIHHFLEMNHAGLDPLNYLRLPKGDVLMLPFNRKAEKSDEPSYFDEMMALRLKGPDGDDDDAEEDDDWEDDEDEDWDDEDEDWDDEDEDWEDDDEDLDEDEDWSDEDEE